MNKENVIRAIKVLEAVPDTQLKMTQWICGTAVCFAGALAESQDIPEIGWSMSSLGKLIPESKNIDWLFPPLQGSQAVAEFLDITSTEAIILCGADGGYGYGKELHDISKADVLAELNYLLQGGSITDSFPTQKSV